MKIMLNKVPKINYEKCYPSRLKRFFKADYGYKTYDSFVPDAKCKIAGNLPHEIIELWDAKDRKRNIKLFYKAMGNMSKYLRACYKECKKNNIINYDFNDLDPENLKLLENDFTKFFNKLMQGILPDNIKISLSYIDRGCWGNVYKFIMYDKQTKTRIMHDKAFKVFHNVKCYVKDLSNSQGVYAEANFWTYLKNIAGHKLDKTQFTRHYVSDLEHGYSLTELADKKAPKTTAPLDLENLFKIFYTDTTNEPINGKIYDVGGCIKFPGFIKDKVIMKYFKKLIHRNSEKDLNDLIENLNAKIANPKTPHRDKIDKALTLFQVQKHKSDFEEAVKLFELEKNKYDQII